MIPIRIKDLMPGMVVLECDYGEYTVKGIPHPSEHGVSSYLEVEVTDHQLNCDTVIGESDAYRLDLYRVY